MKKVIITGVTGQDGSHMADYLLANTATHNHCWCSPFKRQKPR